VQCRILKEGEDGEKDRKDKNVADKQVKRFRGCEEKGKNG
jgi:hypothetical protein